MNRPSNQPNVRPASRLGHREITLPIKRQQPVLLKRCLQTPCIKLKKTFISMTFRLLVGRPVRPLVGWLVRHDFLNGREATLPCSYRSICYFLLSLPKEVRVLHS